jgi:predicted phosphodiesterase
MRIAIVSDIHGNRTAFDAVLADLKETSPDLTLFGGDLSDIGSSPAYILDTIRELGWKGVAGNTDEMLFDPSTLTDFAAPMPAGLQPMFKAIGEMAAFAREALGAERIEWLRGLPRQHNEGEMILLHASPASLWRAPGPDATDTELESTYTPLGQRLIVYGHIHRPFVRSVGSLTVANTGSVGLSYDGDLRASYLLIDPLVDNVQPAIRRVAYDLKKELRALDDCELPHAEWVKKTLQSGRPPGS